MKTVTWYYLKEKSLAENCSRGDDQSLMRPLEWLDSLKECVQNMKKESPGLSLGQLI